MFMGERQRGGDAKRVVFGWSIAIWHGELATFLEFRTSSRAFAGTATAAAGRIPPIRLLRFIQLWSDWCSRSTGPSGRSRRTAKWRMGSSLGSGILQQRRMGQLLRSVDLLSPDLVARADLRSQLKQLRVLNKMRTPRRHDEYREL